MHRAVFGFLAIVLLAVTPAVAAQNLSTTSTFEQLRAAYAAQVDRRLDVPADELPRYRQLLMDALKREGLSGLQEQLLLLVDRSPQVQALLLIWLRSDGQVDLLGASPVSTGRPGGFEYFLTPLGVFRHGPGSPDFRAEGTRNVNGILGYGPAGTRVFDFGWQVGERTWDAGKSSLMRLQLHATDPELLESRLGTPQSKGCIRVPLSLNRFLDRHGILDADYDRAQQQGMKITVFEADRSPITPSGRYLVVVESPHTERPSWSPRPGAVEE